MSVKTIYLLRHTKAEERSVLRPDVDRCLVEKGRQQALRIGAFIRRQQLQPDLVLTSPYPRALQTAMLVAAAADLSCDVQEALWLCHGTAPATQLEQLRQALPDWPLHTLLVGHEPELSALLALLLDAQAAALQIKKGTLVCLQFTPQTGFSLQWLLPCRLLR
jgi:phosphohistidine phosphatase